MIRDLIKPRPPEPSSGLLAQVPTETVERTSGFYIAIVVEVLTVALALWTGISYKNFLGGSGSLGTIVVLTTTLAAFLSLGLYLTKSPLRRIGLLLGTVVGMCLFLPTASTLPFVGGAAAVLVLFLLWGESLGRARVANSLKLRFFHGVHPLLVKFTTAAILGGLLIFLPYWTLARAFPTETSFEAYFKNVGGTVHRFYGELQLTGSFDEFVTSLARYRLLGTSDFRRLPLSRQTAVIEELRVTLKESLSKALHVEPSEEKNSMGKIVYKNLIQILGDLQTRFGPWFLAGWLIIMFLILRGIGTLLYWISAFAAFAAFQVLLMLGVVRMRGETQTQEVAEYV